MLLQETHHKKGDTWRLYDKLYTNHVFASGPKKKAGVAILTCKDSRLKSQKIVRDPKGHYIFAWGMIEEIPLLVANIYVPNKQMTHSFFH